MNRNLLITITLGALLLTPAAWAFTEGSNNNFFGTGAGASNTIGNFNTFMGGSAGQSNTSGITNTFIGLSAGHFNTTGGRNTFLGFRAGSSNTTGNNNTFSGNLAGFSNTTGVDNTFSGYEAGRSNTTGTQNTFSGYHVGYNNTEGNNNTFSGNQAGFTNTTGRRNTFSGNRAGFRNTTGSDNTFSGYHAGDSNTTGNFNTASGHQAGFSNTTGSNNVFLGHTAGYDETSSNRLYIESDNNSRTTPLIYGEFDNDIVGINGTLGVGTQLPTSTLHVRRVDGTASILVEEINPTTAPRTLLQLNNAGNTKFNLNNTDAGVEWAFTNSGNDFRISRQGSGVVEFLLDNSGDLTIQGALTELSSRESKHRITSLNPEQVLSRVLALPIKEWSYKDSKAGIRHVGPMAEDFHAAFGLGENPTGIATLDTSGVALAAIQGLKAEQDKELAALKKEKDAEITALQTKLAQLTQLVQRLAAKDQRASAN